MLLLAFCQLTFAGDWFLAGSFTNWATGKLPMYNQSKASRLVCIPNAGKYEYKFISDAGVWTNDPNRSFITTANNTFVYFETPYNANNLNHVIDGKVYVLGNLGDNNVSWVKTDNREMTYNAANSKFYYTAKLKGIGTNSDNTRFKSTYISGADIYWEAVMSADKGINIADAGVYVLETPLVKEFNDPNSKCTLVKDYAFYYGSSEQKALLKPVAEDQTLYTTTVDMTNINLATTNYYVGIEHAYAPTSVVGLSSTKTVNTLDGAIAAPITLYTNSVTDFSENLGIQVAVPYMAEVTKIAPSKSFFASEVNFTETFTTNAKWHAISLPYDVISIKATLPGESTPRELKVGEDFWLRAYSGKGLWADATALNVDGAGIQSGAYIMAVPTVLKNVPITFTTKGSVVLSEGKLPKVIADTDKAVLISNPYPYTVNASHLVEASTIYGFDQNSQTFIAKTDYLVKPFESVMAWNVSSPEKVAPKSISLLSSYISTALDKSYIDNDCLIYAQNQQLIINEYTGTVSIYKFDGELLESVNVANQLIKTLNKGLYWVSAGDKRVKILIK